MLELSEICAGYDGIQALTNISLNVREKSVVAIVGANGAGKSTLLKTVAGLVRPSSGGITFDGEDISKLRTHERLERGVVLCPEGRRLFPRLTVYENIRMGAYRLRDRKAFRSRLDFVYGIFPRIKERQKQMASSLSGGEQQMVAIARALMSQPRVLMLDEPTLGLAPKLILEVGRLVRTIHEEGITVILVEQNAKLALKISNEAIVLETGAIKLRGDSATLLESDEVRQAYLGGG